MLLAETIDRAAATVQKMAAIPCLRGGIVPFDKNLEAQGWREIDDEWGLVWVPVPDAASDLAQCRVKVEVALDYARRGLTEMIDGLGVGSLAEYPEDLAQLRAPLYESLARLEVA